MKKDFTSPENLITAALFKADSLHFPSAWIGHLPFAAWIIQQVKPKIFVELGTHTGKSYFAFCQSVAQNSLLTSCYAVDTWEGEEHTEKYSDKVYNQVNNYNRDKYAHFSQLLRMSFDEALSNFADESINLLHIDGFHTYEAVKHDFETWLPKLAPGAVVLFHDTQVRERNFGVWKLWKELKAEYPANLEFIHSHGLGVLQLNNAGISQKIDCLGWIPLEQQTLISYFAALGDWQLMRYDLADRDAQLAKLNQVVVDRDTQLANLNQVVADRDAQISALESIIESAMRWQKRSWIKRAFHRWRPSIKN
jgi:hypothetical protein